LPCVPVLKNDGIAELNGIVTMITIKDIAREAKCSLSTVSKAINGKSDVSEPTRQRILDIVETHHYVPNAFGRGLKKKETENIGVIFYRESQPLSGNPFYSRVLEGIEGELAIKNYNLVLQLVPEDFKDECPKMLRERNVDGVMLVGLQKLKFLEYIQTQQIPAVLIDPQIRIEGFSQVVIDNEHGALLAIQYLINQGHRRIGFISGNLERLSFQQRYLGYQQALEYNNIPFRPDYVRTGGLELGYQHVRDLLQLKEHPTAIFSVNDINAIHGYNAVKDFGYQIPGDISIIGFDDIELSKIINPTLTTVRVYKEELGSIAVRMLLKIIRKEIVEPITTMVPIKLIERDSVTEISC
jgi:LacI family transcriptional regulator